MCVWLDNDLHVPMEMYIITTAESYTYLIGVTNFVPVAEP